jgi:hypothetical protein
MFYMVRLPIDELLPIEGEWLATPEVIPKQLFGSGYMPLTRLIPSVAPMSIFLTYSFAGQRIDSSPCGSAFCGL